VFGFGLCFEQYNLSISELGAPFHPVNVPNAMNAVAFLSDSRMVFLHLPQVFASCSRFKDSICGRMSLRMFSFSVCESSSVVNKSSIKTNLYCKFFILLILI